MAGWRRADGTRVSGDGSGLIGKDVGDLRVVGVGGVDERHNWGCKRGGPTFGSDVELGCRR
ncbi:Hypothetical predicted protein, partial [Olea europaea subsp. europaea]